VKREEFVGFVGFVGFVEFVEFVEFIGFVEFIESAGSSQGAPLRQGALGAGRWGRLPRTPGDGHGGRVKSEEKRVRSEGWMVNG